MNSTKQNINITYLGEKEVNLSPSETKRATFYEVAIQKTKKQTLTHHILLIDVSKSMDLYINQLKQTLITTLNALKSRKGNLVTIILYSHHDQTYPILCGIPCDTQSFEDACVFEVIEKEVYTRENTIFSEALSTAFDYINKFEPHVDQQHLILLSDGEAVPKHWSIEEEVSRCQTLAQQFKEKNIIFNAIGFGTGYDRDLLIDLVQRSGSGLFNHIDFIKDYKTLLVDLFTTLKRSKPIALQIENHDYLVVSEGFCYNAPQTFYQLSGNQKSLIVTFDGPLICNHHIEVLDCGVSNFYLAELGYGLACNYLQAGSLEKALMALRLTGDVFAYHQLQHAYSFLELGNAISFIHELRLKPKKRYKAGYNLQAFDKAPKNTLCVLEVLQELVTHQGVTLWWDYSYDYERIGVKKNRLEDLYEFSYPTVGFAKVSKVTIGSSKLNVGLRVKVWGHVQNTLNLLKLEAYVIRDFNLILNGNLNIPYVWCELPPKLKQKYRQAKLLKRIIPYGKKEICVLKLNHLRMTHYDLLTSISPDALAQKIYKCEELSCHLASLKKLIQRVELMPQHGEFNAEVYDILKAYRVSATGLYEPLEVISSSDEAHEVYKADKLQWSVDRFPRKKVEDEALSLYAPYVGEDAVVYKSRLMDLVKLIKHERQLLLDEVNVIRLSSGLMKQSVFVWDSEKEKKKVESDKVLNQNAVMGEKALESIASVDEIKIRQLKYSVLVPIN